MAFVRTTRALQNSVIENVPSVARTKEVFKIVIILVF
jgi:hypothetical protein